MASLEAQSRADEGSRRALFSFQLSLIRTELLSQVENQSYNDIKTTYSEALADLLFRTGDIALTREELERYTMSPGVVGVAGATLNVLRTRLFPRKSLNTSSRLKGRWRSEVAGDRGKSVHVVNVTEKMRKLAREGQALFQEKRQRRA
jgi:hypothetical protein